MTTLTLTVFFPYGLWNHRFVSIVKMNRELLHVDVWFSMAVTATTSTTFVHKEVYIHAPVNMVFHKVWDRTQ